jgi:hypothetical protein
LVAYRRLPQAAVPWQPCNRLGGGLVMTIRERLNRNKRRQSLLVGVTFVPILAGPLLSPLSRSIALCLFLGGLVVAILILLYGQVSDAFRCPQCGGSLVILAMQMNANPFSINRRIRYCPFCGVDIDTEESTKPTAKGTEWRVTTQ